jgi:hypothetical protein
MSGRDESSTARDFRWPGITWGEPKAESVSAAVAQAASLVLVSFAYYLAILASIRLRLGYSSLSVIWPSNAILLAVLVLAPK